MTNCFLCKYNQVVEDGRMCKECIKLMTDIIRNENIR